MSTIVKIDGVYRKLRDKRRAKTRLDKRTKHLVKSEIEPQILKRNYAWRLFQIARPELQALLMQQATETSTP